jgi:hypothetical protein
MGGNVRFILDKEDKRYTSKVYTSCIGALVSHHALWASDWQRYSEVLSYYEVPEQDDLTEENIIDHYGMVYINWDTKEIHQFMDDYAFEGFYVSNMSFEARGNVIYSKDLPQDCWEVNALLLNLKNKNTLARIECYARDENNDYIDFYVYYNRKVNGTEIVKMIEEFRKIEESPQLLSKYGLKASIDVSSFKKITLDKFMMCETNWNLELHRSSQEKWKEVGKKIKGFPQL